MPAVKERTRGQSHFADTLKSAIATAQESGQLDTPEVSALMEIGRAYMVLPDSKPTLCKEFGALRRLTVAALNLDIGPSDAVTNAIGDLAKALSTWEIGGPILTKDERAAAAAIVDSDKPPQMLQAEREAEPVRVPLSHAETLWQELRTLQTIHSMNLAACGLYMLQERLRAMVAAGPAGTSEQEQAELLNDIREVYKPK